jgi:hypothetical protein
MMVLSYVSNWMAAMDAAAAGCSHSKLLSRLEPGSPEAGKLICLTTEADSLRRRRLSCVARRESGSMSNLIFDPLEHAMKQRPRIIGNFAWRAACCAILMLATTPTWGQTRVVAVEEHWEMVVAEADPAISAPQVTMVMSPNGSLAGDHFLFLLNHETAPDYHAGGMQVQHWYGDTMDDYDHSCEYGTLSYSAEVIRWVQRIATVGGALHFDIENGSSTTWGSFSGGPVDLSVGSSITNLNQYSPAISLTESQVNHAENRVTSLTLKKIRWWTDDGQMHEQNAPIPIDMSLDPQ